ncbi:DUF2142 domain-containing protein [Intrasporangium oryzae]|uniref:DUF2142 domain-containing protein n=1 Tax=Intrasporangium oryzae TaxID=412687 RepID=UPI0012F898D3|nr:DUF2142 domain-containing protein [Intrasporangium oryzae]
MILRTDDRLAVTSAALGTALATCYALAGPPGQPYDEPAHWSTVLFYALRHRMPELGEPGSTYESQMGPAYYSPAGLLVEVLGVPGDRLGLYGLRLVGVLLVPLLAWLTHRLALAVHPDRGVAGFAVAAVSLSPLLLAIGGSIQNDYLAIVLATVALLQGARVLRRPESPAWRHLVVGVLIGLAVLAKVVAVSLLAALLLTYAVQRGVSLRRRAGWAAAAVAGTALSCGWWFVRNLAVYGDLTGAARMAESGYHFPPMRFSSLGEVQSWVSSLISYVFVPVEYYRNVFSTPAPLRLVAGVVTLAALGVLAAYVVRTVGAGRLGPALLDRPDRVLLVSAVVMAIAFYLAYSVLVWFIAARLAFLTASAAAILFGVASRDRAGDVVRVGVLGLYVAASVWLVLRASSVPAQPYWIFPG